MNVASNDFVENRAKKSYAETISPRVFSSNKETNYSSMTRLGRV